MQERGLTLGDSIFTSVRVEGGVAILWDYHIEKLKKAESETGIKVDLANVIIPNATGILRITAYRDVEYKGYLPLGDGRKTIVTFTPSDFLVKNIALSIYDKPHGYPFSFKSGSSLFYILAKRFAKKNNTGDCIILKDGFIVETSSTNIFFVKDGVLHTPHYCGINGAVRQYIIDNYRVQTGNYTIEFMETAEEIFLTNALNITISVKGEAVATAIRQKILTST
jgi:4-amino-4-deoxychorismate lyase